MKTGFLTASLLAAALALPAAPAAAQHRGGGGAVAGHAAPRALGPRGISPRGGAVRYRPYFYRYRPGLAFGFYGGFPGYYYGYPYGYWGYGYGYDPFYGYGYGYPGYYPPAGYASYGGVRIQGAPRDAQVFADGYYVGAVDDFDGTFQHLNLEPGPHRIEIRRQGGPPIAFDVNVRPGETVTYHAEIR